MVKKSRVVKKYKTIFKIIEFRRLCRCSLTVNTYCAPALKNTN